MNMMNNSTEVPDVNNTPFDDHRVAPILIAFASIIVVYIIVANSILIACFIINRSRIWNGFSRQVFNLAISDLLVGLSGIPLLIVSDVNLATSFTFCTAAFYMLFGTQNGTLFNILGICIQRTLLLKTIRKQATPKTNSTRYSVILIGAWTISLLLSSVPYIVWGRADLYDNICASNLIFGHKFKQALRFLFSLYLIPLVFTDLLYTYASFRLYYIWSRKVSPDPCLSNNPSCTANTPDINTRSNSIRAGQGSFRPQRAVFGTIGILLLLLNVFTLPILLIISMAQIGEVDRNIRWFGTIMYMFNSAVNPIVYAIRIKSLRDGLRQMFLRCWSMMH